jgi:error-prone DNA polymerase
MSSTAPDYIELHASSAFSFLRGANDPESLLRAAHALGLPQLAVLDRDGVYGSPRAYQAARDNNMTARVGAEITLADGSALPLLVKNRTGYKNLCRLITASKLNARPPSTSSTSYVPPPSSPSTSTSTRAEGAKRPCFATWDELTLHSDGLIALTGDEDGPLARALATGDLASAEATTARLKTIFGPDNVCIELQRRRIRGEDLRIQLLADLAASQKLPLLATSGARYATPDDRLVADAFTCLRHHTTLDQAGRLLSENSERHLRSAAQMRALFADHPEALANTVRIADRLDFTLENLGYEFPAFPVPPGETMPSYLRAVTLATARTRFPKLTKKVRDQLDTELALISRLGFAGYFLIIWDICKWAREERHTLIQGRGSAANSAVCYMLGITAVNPLEHELLFERFLSEGRLGADGKPSWPDVDLDLPSGDRREEVIQEIYKRYAPHGAAMVANVITYRGRSTTREMGKILGLPEDALNRFSALYANGDFSHTLDFKKQLHLSGLASSHPRLPALLALCNKIKGLPRHLGQHSGGMVLCPGHLHEVVPLEPASMENRTIVQWDKDDCEDLGLVKIDFLGLGMMAVLQDCFELCTSHPDGPTSFDDIPRDDPATYKNIVEAKTVGVFQIESRAQMSTLPRFKPRNLYDLAQQVAIVRPGPIVGNLVHPLIKRRDGLEPIDYIDPSLTEKLEPILRRTCGVILFQEQMIAIAMSLAGFTGGEAEELRRAMGFTKKTDRLDKIKAKLRAHLEARGHAEPVVKKIGEAVSAFAFYGFPESHAISFALLAYASTWLKTHRAPEFIASLLNNQPMGFYSAATLLQDGRRNCGLQVRAVCVQHSAWKCTVEPDRALRLGLSYIKGLRERSVSRMLIARAEKPFATLDDFLARTEFNPTERRALAAVGALNVFAGHRRAALWQAEAAWSPEETLFRHFAAASESTLKIDLEGAAPSAPFRLSENPTSAPSLLRETPPTSTSPIASRPSPHLDFPLRPMTLTERLAADFAGMSLTAGKHPMQLARAQLPDVTPASELIAALDGHEVTIAGSVICRQRPGTAKGVVFISLEDETGIANAIVYAALFERLRLTITQESALRITGKLQHKAGVAHVRAEKIAPLHLEEIPAQASHDFH